MQDMILELLWRSPDTQEEISRFLADIPKCRRTERAFFEALGPVEQALGRERFGELMDKLCAYTAQRQCAHYAFGLGLRRELLRALCAE